MCCRATTSPPQVDISEYGWKVDGQQAPEQVLGLQILLQLNYCRSLHAAARQTSLAQETIVTARKIKCPGQVTAHALQKTASCSQVHKKQANVMKTEMNPVTQNSIVLLFNRMVHLLSFCTAGGGKILTTLPFLPWQIDFRFIYHNSSFFARFWS